MPEETVQAASSTLSEAFLSPLFLGIVLLLLVFECLYKNRTFFHDDTYITLRYARHILAGYGPVWNTVGPRVEGFTSVLHLLLVSAVGALRVPWRMAARAVNFASHLALIFFVGAYLARRFNRTAALLACLILAASWMLLIWDLGGLDAVLYTALSTIGCLTSLDYFASSGSPSSKPLLLAALYLAFATLARPEGAMLLAALFLFATLFSPEPLAPRLRSLAAAAALAILVLAPIVLFRWLYFHQWAPNTFYAKIGGINRLSLVSLGFRYMGEFLATPPFLGPLALLAALYSIGKRRFTMQDAILWAMIAIPTLFIILSGGDHMLAFRFCLPLVPLLTVALLQSLCRTGLLDNPWFLSACIPLLLVLLALQSWPAILNPLAIDPAASVGELIGHYIHQHWPAGSIIALNTAGSTPFYADHMQYIDMLGLNDAAIAHRTHIPETGPWTHLVGHLKGDGSSVLSRHPDYIILGPAEGTTPELRAKVYFIGDYEIGSAPSFRADYELCTAPLSSKLTLTFYQRRDAHPLCQQGP